MKNIDINIGDLVRLKGFKLSDPSEVPYGLVEHAGYPTSQHCRVQWLNTNIAERFALTKLVEKIKLEIIQKANQSPKKA